jgi:hypothetical protein
MWESESNMSKSSRAKEIEVFGNAINGPRFKNSTQVPVMQHVKRYIISTHNCNLKIGGRGQREN